MGDRVDDSLSWWVGLSREDFARRVREEQERMSREAIDPMATAIARKTPQPRPRQDKEEAHGVVE